MLQLIVQFTKIKALKPALASCSRMAGAYFYKESYHDLKKDPEDH